MSEPHETITQARELVAVLDRMYMLPKGEVDLMAMAKATPAPRFRAYIECSRLLRSLKPRR